MMPSRPLGPVHHLHFVGIGGVGMCGLAEVMLAQGLAVSGCDLSASDRTRRLHELGASVHEGHDPTHVVDADALVVSAAVAEDTAEVAAARANGLPVVRRAELLGELMRLRRAVAIAGTHGKTTTTSLVDCALRGQGYDPTVVVGGRLLDHGGHGRLGTDPVLVCEADEFDRSFLMLSPVWAVITNIEAEHLECYGSLDDLDAAFLEFAHRTPFYGAVICCADDPGVQRLLPHIDRRVVTYGFGTEATVRATGTTSTATGVRFAVVDGDATLGEVNLPLYGLHNVHNALAAIAVAAELGRPIHRTPEAACSALADFSGVARRFEVRGERDGVTVVDDYAHHPTEIEAVLRAAREAYPGRRLVAVFQPHLYSRTRTFAAAFARALVVADEVVVMPVYAAREAPIEGVNAKLVAAEAVRLGHRRIAVCADLPRASALLDRLTRSGDVVLTLGAGDVHAVGETWLGGGR
jgi:UDP-N-acetylmuramate--alanine ligase